MALPHGSKEPMCNFDKLRVLFLPTVPYCIKSKKNEPLENFGELKIIGKKC